MTEKTSGVSTKQQLVFLRARGRSGRCTPDGAVVRHWRRGGDARAAVVAPRCDATRRTSSSSGSGCSCAAARRSAWQTTACWERSCERRPLRRPAGAGPEGAAPSAARRTRRCAVSRACEALGASVGCGGTQVPLRRLAHPKKRGWKKKGSSGRWRSPSARSQAVAGAWWSPGGGAAVAQLGARPAAHTPRVTSRVALGRTSATAASAAPSRASRCATREQCCCWPAARVTQRP
jgi:hypothetical protein